MQECRDESEIYNYQRIQLLHDKFINGILGVPKVRLDCNSDFVTNSYGESWDSSCGKS